MPTITILFISAPTGIRTFTPGGIVHIGPTGPTGIIRVITTRTIRITVGTGTIIRGPLAVEAITSPEDRRWDVLWQRVHVRRVVGTTERAPLDLRAAARIPTITKRHGDVP